MPTIDITLPRLHPKQQEIRDKATRFNVLSCGRRFGKDVFGIDCLVDPDTLAWPQAWFSPSYKLMLEVWREVDQQLKPMIARRSIQERRLELLGGGVIDFWSLDDVDAGRGRRYKRVIINEAGLVKSLWDTWNYAIRPTLADFKGDAFFMGTPKGRNDFWRLYQLGQDDSRPDWSSFQVPSHHNPHVPASEFDAMRDTLPERVYLQEIMADFIDDAGGVFRGVMRAVDAGVWQDEPIDQHQYIFGVDWGKLNDYTVITVVDVTLGHVCYIDRFNKIDYVVQAQRLKVLAEKFRPAQIIAESNSMGGAVIEQLQRMGLPITPFNTTNATKSAIIDGLANAFERDAIRIPDDATLISELQAYESQRTKNGLFTYNAPSGLHDDMVMSLAIGWSGMGAGIKLLW
jgi:hypothetical protein